MDDNTKVSVIRAFLYEPHINRASAEMATHYGTAILPARPSEPLSLLQPGRTECCDRRDPAAQCHTPDAAGSAVLFCQWSVHRVGVDYDVELARHFYSVPYRYGAAKSRRADPRMPS
jgi:hypothetical protein